MNSDFKGALCQTDNKRPLRIKNEIKQIKMVDLELEKLFQDDPWLRPYQGQLQER